MKIKNLFFILMLITAPQSFCMELNSSDIFRAIDAQDFLAVQMLIAHGANVDAQNTALSYAVKKGNRAIVELLINAHANIYAQDQEESK